MTDPDDALDLAVDTPPGPVVRVTADPRKADRFRDPKTGAVYARDTPEAKKCWPR